jgi:hypothetical protein
MARTGVLVLALLLLLAASLWLLLPRGAERDAQTTALRFEVTVAEELRDAPREGRLLVVLGRDKDAEPRTTIGETGMEVPPVLGKDVKGLAPGVTAVVDQTAVIFPIESLAALPRGDYQVQAVLDVNRDLKLPNAPGNLYSKPQMVTLDSAKGGAVKLELSQRVPDDVLKETEYVKFVKLRSEKLSKFHGRPMYLRAGVVLPKDHATETDRRYPLRVHIGGYGTRYTHVERMMGRGAGFRNNWLAEGTPRMILLLLDGAGPYGDPYQVNSANNGPYGDAVTQELIPYVEEKYRGVGKGHARVLDGASTGGWVSLALQFYYPDFFNGAWSHAPDPVDFRAFELIDIYSDENAYINRRGFERPSARELNGDTRFTLRHEVQIEKVLGDGDRWELSGKDWCAWNAVFGPRGDDGKPRPLWDGKTGKIDRGVLEHWQQYDLRRVLARDWKTLGPRLRGKIHVWVGEADDYFLNNAVHLLDDFLSGAKPPYEGKITYASGRGHDWRGQSEKDMVAEMAAAIEKAGR